MPVVGRRSKGICCRPDNKKKCFLLFKTALSAFGLAWGAVEVDKLTTLQSVPAFAPSLTSQATPSKPFPIEWSYLHRSCTTYLSTFTILYLCLRYFSTYKSYKSVPVRCSLCMKDHYHQPVWWLLEVFGSDTKIINLFAYLSCNEKSFCSPI